MSFDWSALLPLEVGVSMAVLPGVLNAVGRRRAAALAVGGQFGFSLGLRIFLWMGVFITAMVPFIVQVGPFKCERASCAAHLGTGLAITFCMLVFFMLCGAMWADRYVVTLMEDSFMVGAFSKTKMRYKDVISLNTVISSRGTPFLHIYSGKNLKLKIDGNLQNFDDLVEKLKARVESVKAGHGVA